MGGERGRLEQLRLEKCGKEGGGPAPRTATSEPLMSETVWGPGPWISGAG